MTGADPHVQLAVSAVIRRDDTLLLVRRARPPAAGTWALPGGRVRFDEGVTDALVREVREETGLEVDVGRLLGWDERRASTPEPSHFVILNFLARVVGERRAPVPGDDADRARWTPLREVPTLPMPAGLPEYLRAHDVLSSGAAAGRRSPERP